MVVPEGVQVIHFRCREAVDSTGKTKVLVNGGVTVAVRQTFDDIESACSVCSVRDSFDPSDGAKRAVARLTSTPHKGRKNTKRVRDSALYPEGRPREVEYFPQMEAGFDYLTEMAVGECLGGLVDMVVCAWTAAVHAVLTMEGGTAIDREQLRETLSGIPRGVKVKPLPKKEEETAVEKPA